MRLRQATKTITMPGTLNSDHSTLKPIGGPAVKTIICLYETERMTELKLGKRSRHEVKNRSLT